MSEILIMGIFFSIILGTIIGFLIFLFKKNLQKRNAIKKIKKQKMTYRIGGRKYNFTGGEDDGLEKVVPKKPGKIKEKLVAGTSKTKTKKKPSKRKKAKKK